MVISVSPKLWERALNGEREIMNAITQLLIWVESGKHKIIFEDIDVERIIMCSHFSNYSETIRAILVEEFYRNHEHQIIVRITENSFLSNIINSKICFGGKLLIKRIDNIEFHYLDYLYIETYLSRPLYIVVENCDSDRAFVKTAYSTVINSNIPLDYNLPEPLNMDADTRLEFRHGGGNTTHSVISTFIYPTRALCIIDSDKKYPTCELEEKVVALIELCTERNFDIIILNKREIENYLPDEAIKNWLSSKHRNSEINHQFFSFNELQKSFFDVKKGIKYQEYSEINEIRDIFQNAFSSINPEDYVTPKAKILDGFGSNVWEAFNETACGIQNFHHDSIEEFKNIVNKMHCKI